VCFCLLLFVCLVFGLFLFLFLVCFWFVFGLFLVCFWFVFGLFLVCFWFVFGLFLVCFWFVFGLFLVCFWFVFGLFFVCVCFVILILDKFFSCFLSFFVLVYIKEARLSSISYSSSTKTKRGYPHFRQVLLLLPFVLRFSLQKGTGAILIKLFLLASFRSSF